jgi:hypothetical protein
MIRFLGVFLFVLLNAPIVSAKGPAMTTIWRTTDATLERCLDVARQAITASGFLTDVATDGGGVYGQLGEYTGSIQCVSDVRVIFVVVAGPLADECVKLRILLEKKFEVFE